jgi:hypothetical protein
MSTRAFLYALWCLGIAGLFLASGYFAWSPFADGGRAAPRAGVYGPTHK